GLALSPAAAAPTPAEGAPPLAGWRGGRGVGGPPLPIDVPEPERATLGGAIAGNVSGPRRYGYGTFRDYVIGVNLVNDRGEETKAGGRVVKNVAGYDLMKLYTGGLGTLGIITQVTVKLRPVPETWGAYVFSVAPERLAAALDRVHGTQTRPMSVWFGAGGHETKRWQKTSRPLMYNLAVGFEGGREAVDWQLQQAQAELA